MKRKPKKIALLYLGRRRQPGSEKVFHAFLPDKKKEEIYFTSMGYGIIGSWYWGGVDKDGFTMPVLPEHVADREGAPEADIQKWEVQDKLADQFLKRKAMAAKLKREPIFMRSVESLRPHVQHLTHLQKRMLLEWMLEKLSKG